MAILRRLSRALATRRCTVLTNWHGVVALSTDTETENASTETTTETETEPAVEFVDSAEIEDDEERRVQMGRYPRPRTETKEIHLRSLRRSHFSTAACLDEAQEDSRRCAWCKTVANNSEYFCSECNKLLPVIRHQNLFEVFGLEPQFEINLKLLDGKYKSLQLKFHPDRFASKTRLEQSLATAQSALINRAFRKLKLPIDRAKYLLSLKAYPFQKEQIMTDPELLMEMMEMQEALSNAGNREELMNAFSETTDRQETLLDKLAQAFKDDDLKRASDIVVELSYVERIIQIGREKM